MYKYPCMLCICKLHSSMIPYTNNWMSCFQNTIIRQLNWKSFVFLECREVSPMYGFAETCLDVILGHGDVQQRRFRYSFVHFLITVLWYTTTVFSWTKKLTHLYDQLITTIETKKNPYLQYNLDILAPLHTFLPYCKWIIAWHLHRTCGDRNASKIEAGLPHHQHSY